MRKFYSIFNNLEIPKTVHSDEIRNPGKRTSNGFEKIQV